MVTVEEVIRLCIDPERLDGFLSRVLNPRTMRKELAKLDHLASLNLSRAEWFPSMDVALRKLDLPPQTPALVLSPVAQLHGKVMPLAEAVERITSSLSGAIIGINPNLAVYYGEPPGGAAVIHRQ